MFNSIMSRRPIEMLIVTTTSSLLVSGCTPTIGVLNPAWQTNPNPPPSADTRPLSDKLKIAGNPWKGPAVEVLEDHITCQLIRDYQRYATSASYHNWTYLSTFHFVAAINLSLSVVNNEGANLSASWISPTNGAGKALSPIIFAPTSGSLPSGTTATSASYNYTMAVGGQLSGAQTTTLTFQYQLDMQRIALAAAYLDILDANDNNLAFSDNQQVRLAAYKAEADPDFKPISAFAASCYGDRSNGPIRSLATTLKGDLLQGDLALTPTIEDGLNVLDAAGPFNIYGSAGPIHSDKGSAGVAANPAVQSDPDLSSLRREAQEREAIRGRTALKAAGPSRQEWAYIVGSGAGGKPQGSSPPSGGAASPNSFAATINFNLMGGLNGGPNWTLLEFKGPGAGGGGGGASGGASSGGSGGASSGGGGGGGQPFSISRSSSDTMTITFAPTCKSNTEFPLSIGAIVPDDRSVDLKKALANATFSVPIKVYKPDKSVDGMLSVSAPANTLGNVRSATGYIEFGSTAGSVNWIVYLLPHEIYRFAGTITDVNNQQVLGAITFMASASTASQKTNQSSGVITDDVLSKLGETGQPMTYWDTIPGCDTVTGPVVQSIVASAVSNSQTLMTQQKLGN